MSPRWKNTNKTYHRMTDCGKAGFTGMAAAETAASRLRHSGYDAVGVRPYLCPDCGMFHVGHSSKTFYRGER